MKIALLTTDNREHLKDYGAPQPCFGAAPEALIEGFAQLPDVEVHVISCVRQEMKSPEKLANNIWYHPLLVPKLGWLTTGYQGCIRAVRRKLREIAPDIVHGQGTERECAISAVFSGYPNVVTIHGNMAGLAKLFQAPRFSYLWLVAQLEDFTLPRTDGVFCNSAYTQSLVRPRAKRVWRVANAIRSPFFGPALSQRKDDAPASIVNVGVISPRKRQLEILDLAKQLYDEGRNVRFFFVGSISKDDAYASAFLSRMEAAETAGYASFLGTKPTEELIALLDQSDALLHFPSEEAFGLVVVEALARNIKFFGSEAGGIVDIAQGVELAELYPIEGWAPLKKGIADWLNRGHPKPAHVSDLIAAHYHPRVIATRHLEIYREVLNSSS